MYVYVVNAIIFMLIFVVFRICFGQKPDHIKSLSGKHVFITGGSSGIGFALAKKCASEKCFVTLIARSEDKLVKAHDSLIEIVGCESDHIRFKAVDVTNAAAVSLAIEESFRRRPIDILICNAGQVVPGMVDAVDVKTLESVVKTNLLGSVYTIHAALPLMKSRSVENPSSIVIMSSMSCLCFAPGANMYAPTKYALKGLAETLRIELRPHNIRVHLVCPGFTTTPMLDISDEVFASLEIKGKSYLYNRAQTQSPNSVARITMEKVKRGDFLITTAWNGHLLAVLSRGFMPAESVIVILAEMILGIPLRLFSLIYAKFALETFNGDVDEGLKERPDLHKSADSTMG